MTAPRRDRLRELLDAVLADDNTTLDAMADSAFASPFHFSRTLASGAGEPPVALRRRVMLERAAWRLGRGASVTEVAIEAGYESVDGFSRAFTRAYGHPPSTPAADTGHRLPAPNGVHFHPPTNLWVDTATQRPTGHELVATLAHHDLADTTELLDAAATLPVDELARVRAPGRTVLPWDGIEENLAASLDALVWTKEVWLASIEGRDQPTRAATDVVTLRARHDEVAPRWLAVIRGADELGTWGDRIVDALCDPPESFVLSGIVAHVMTFSAHRRQLVRSMLRDAGVDVGTGDPLEWLARRAAP